MTHSDPHAMSATQRFTNAAARSAIPLAVSLGGAGAILAGAPVYVGVACGVSSIFGFMAAVHTLDAPLKESLKKTGVTAVVALATSHVLGFMGSMSAQASRARYESLPVSQGPSNISRDEFCNLKQTARFSSTDGHTYGVYEQPNGKKSRVLCLRAGK